MSPWDVLRRRVVLAVLLALVPATGAAQDADDGPASDDMWWVGNGVQYSPNLFGVNLVDLFGLDLPHVNYATPWLYAGERNAFTIVMNAREDTDTRGGTISELIANVTTVRARVWEVGDDGQETLRYEYLYPAEEVTYDWDEIADHRLECLSFWSAASCAAQSVPNNRPAVGWLPEGGPYPPGVYRYEGELYFTSQFRAIPPGWYRPGNPVYFEVFPGHRPEQPGRADPH